MMTEEFEKTVERGDPPNNNAGGGSEARNFAAVEKVWSSWAESASAAASGVVWQDNIDPDNMTYEELLDLGEAVGTQSRGLSQEQISLLPVTKYKCGFFSRKKRRERCVICQMKYRRGNLQMALPRKHVYHASCVTKWLSINKVCPVCFAEVPGEEPDRK